MKKIFTCLILVLVMLASFGCGLTTDDTRPPVPPPPPPESEDQLHGLLVVDVQNLGYGTEWIKALADEFKLQHKHVEVDVDVSEPGAVTTETMLSAGPKVNEADILFHQYPNHLVASEKTLENGQRQLAELTDVYASKVEGYADETIASRMFDALEVQYNYRGLNQYYAMPFINDVNGLYYNVSLFEENSWEVPKTSNQLEDLSRKIKTTTKVNPFTWFHEYWQFVYPIWWAQLEGVKNYEQFFNKDPSIIPSSPNSPYITQANSIKAALDTMGQVTTKEDGFFNYDEAWKTNFKDKQVYFADKKSAMMPNGGWFERELGAKADASKMGIMKLPVTSALGIKLGITEELLVNLIKYIDGDIATKPSITTNSFYTEEEILQKVTAARMLVCSTTAYQNAAMIPSYSEEIDIAKEFLRFMTTDKAMQIMMKTAGIVPSVKHKQVIFDNLELSYLKQSKVKIIKSNYTPLSIVYYNNEMMYKNGLYIFNQSNQHPVAIFAGDGLDRRTSQKYLEDEITHMSRKWQEYVDRLDF